MEATNLDYLPRKELERRASAVVELRRRKLSGKTVYGIVHPDKGLTHCITRDGQDWVKTDDSPTVNIPAKLERFLTTKKLIKVLAGGRGGAKSESIGSILTSEVKDQQYKVGCFRELQTSIDDSVHALLSDKIIDIGYAGFDTLNNKISHSDGGEFKFKGLSRNPDAVKSMHGFKRFWVEEAQSISHKSLKKLIPTLRGEDVECWFSMNQESSADPMSQRFLKPFEKQLNRDGYYEDDVHLIIKINYDDNPWFPDNLEALRLKDKANLSEAEYEHIWEGAYNDTVRNAIISTKWFDCAIDAHIHKGFKAQGSKILSHDPSDEGPDDKGLAIRHGSVITYADDMDTGDIDDGCTWALDEGINQQVDVFRWDGDGMGVALKKPITDALNGKRTDIDMFKGSHGVDDPDAIYEPVKNDPYNRRKNQTNKQTFKNKRSQYYWALRNRFYNTYRCVVLGEYVDPETMISLSSEGISNMDQLRSEICRIPLKKNPNGYIQIMSKDQMWLEYEIPSPNLADSVMMTMPAPPVLQEAKPVKPHIPQSMGMGRDF